MTFLEIHPLPSFEKGGLKKMEISRPLFHKRGKIEKTNTFCLLSNINFPAFILRLYFT